MISILVELLRALLPSIFKELFNKEPNVMDEVNRIKAEVDEKYKKVKDDKDPSDVADYINRIK